MDEYDNGLDLHVYPLIPFIYIILLMIIVCYGNLVTRRLLELLIWIELNMINYEFIYGMRTTYFRSLDYLKYAMLWVIFIFPMTLSNIFDLEASPNVILEYMVVNKHVRFGGIISIFIQILGDYLAFIFVPMLWLCFGHKRDPLKCFSTFYKSNAMYTFVLEWLLTIIHRLSVYIVIRISRHLSEDYLALISSTLLAFFRIVGYYLVGSLNNPALGASLRISCSGIHDYRSLLVYWAAPFCGSLCALFLLYLCKQVADLYVTSEPVFDTRIYLTLEDIRYKMHQRFERVHPWSINVCPRSINIPFKLDMLAI